MRQDVTGGLQGKTLKHILLDRLLNKYGYNKGHVTAKAIADDILSLIEQYYRFTDNLTCFPKTGPFIMRVLSLACIMKEVPEDETKQICPEAVQAPCASIFKRLWYGFLC